MLFKPHHIEAIRSETKTVTRRDWDANYNRPNPGTIVPATTDMFVPKEEADCFIKIGEIYKEPLGDMTDEDAQKEGGYETVEEFREAWRAINGEWDPSLVVDVVPFNYVGKRYIEGMD